jgi:hypothetical protein
MQAAQTNTSHRLDWEFDNNGCDTIVNISYLFDDNKIPNTYK